MMTNVDWRRGELRGVFAAVARELSNAGRPISPQGVRQAYLREKEDIVVLVAEKIAERKAIRAAARRRLANAIAQ